MSENKIPYKIYLSEDEMPKAWYNLRADMTNKPAPLLNPATLQPMTAQELEGVFCAEPGKAGAGSTPLPFFEIPQEFGTSTRCTVPLPWYGPTAWKGHGHPRQNLLQV